LIMAGVFHARQSRRAVVAAGLAASVGSWSWVALAATSIDHSSKIKTVNQGNANLCWLACMAMLGSWQRGGSPVSMEDAAKRLGPPFFDFFTIGVKDPKQGALPLSLVSLLAKTAGAKAEGLKSLKTTWWVERITAGPVLVAGYSAGAVMAHAVLIVGLSGDVGKPEDITVTLVDPDGAVKRTKKFLELIAFYEGLAPTAADPNVVALQLIYFK
jgi:hypothetical protein